MAFEQVATDCDAGDIAACRSDVQTVHDEVVSFQTVLDQHPAPPCLTQTDALLRLALTDYHDAAEVVMRGIDTGSTEDVQAGAQLLDQGGTHLDDAAKTLKQVSC
ncbi:MAG TPA: hypothetical protein VFW17_13370 [Ktedonobacterales bacterium]|nr:hypothetical protein [Ktedonobacterales bacterium]